MSFAAMRCDLGKVPAVKAYSLKAAALLSLTSLTLALGACGEDTRQSLAQCKIEATRLYQLSSLIDDVRAANYITNCMEAKGYRFISVAGCLGASSQTNDASCYKNRPLFNLQ